MSARLFTSALDTVLDKTVVPGYSRLGPAVRRLWWPSDPPPDSLTGKHVIVTGAGSGLGQAAASGLAALGATVHLVGRSVERLHDAAGAIRVEVDGADLVLEACDLSDLDSVRAYADAFPSDPVHALVHNAGVMPPERSTSRQGHELTLTTHVLGPFLLTGLLRPRLALDGDARVVWVASGGMYTQPFTHELATDLEYERGDYSGTIAYARTKRMQVIVAAMLAERLAGDHVVVHSMHPGWADTPAIASSMPAFARATAPILRTPAQGADTVVWLAAAPEATATTGLFWNDRRARPTTYLPSQIETTESRQLLWDLCCEATGVTLA